MIFDIEKSAEKYKNKTAYKSEGKSLSFGVLFEKAKELSFEIADSKAKTAAVIGNRSAETMAAIIACVLSECAYVPIDISIPKERKEKIIEKSGASIIIDCSEEKTEIRKIKEPETEKNKNAYIIFTSGSTGEPKGVPVSYENLDNFIQWITKLSPLDEFEHASVLNHASFSFDLSTAALYYSLFGGHTLVQAENTGDYEKLFSEIKENKINIMVATPTFLRICLLNRDFDKENYPDMKCIYFCGETLQKSLVSAIFKRFPDIRIINAYGPTEAASAVCAIEITGEMLEEEEILPVGRLDSSAVEITAENGELVLKGKSVSEGYLSGEKGGFYKENGKNCFRTGDIGFVENGKIYCRGRLDSQIKYKGYRIELSDIEANISALPGTKNCAVVAKRNPEGEVRLIKAFVSGKISEDEIRKELSKKLPEYMIPKSIEKIDFLPLNKNGKTDRKELMKL